jgi:HSP20 family protein
MANIAKRNYGFFDNNFRSFDDMIDSFFNDNFMRRGSVYESTFKVDVSQDDKGYTVEAEMPGFSKDDIKISVDQGKLLLEAAKNEEVNEDNEEKNYIHRERRSSQMSRSMYFPDIDENDITAKLEDGVLTVRLGKKAVEETKKHIAIE